MVDEYIQVLHFVLDMNTLIYFLNLVLHNVEDMIEKDMILAEVDMEIVMEDNHLVVEDNYLVVEDNLLIGHIVDN